MRIPNIDENVFLLSLAYYVNKVALSAKIDLVKIYLPNLYFCLRQHYGLKIMKNKKVNN